LLTSHAPSALFLFTKTPTTEIYSLSLHDALPIYDVLRRQDRAGAEIPPERVLTELLLQVSLPQDVAVPIETGEIAALEIDEDMLDRKSTRLNSSHVKISYAVFCLKKKKKKK